MAFGGNILSRAMSYVANELLVNGLANSPAFQRFAVRTSQQIENMSRMALKTREEFVEQMKQISKQIESSGKQ